MEAYYMKRVIALVMVCAMSFAFWGCGKKDESKSSGATEATTHAADQGGKEATDLDNVTFTQKDNMLVFSVNSELLLKQDAWLGFCPGTNSFVKEADADEVDVLYSYIANGDKQDGEDYLFEFGLDSIGGLDDGDYVMVLCDSDDETVGKVLLYIPCKISGTTVNLDFDKIVVNR